MKQLAVPDPMTTGVVLLGRGSSDIGANGELARMARWIFEANEHELVDLAFTGVTWPRLETVVQRQVRLGMMQICIIPVYLFTGVLIERIKAQVERLQRQYPQVAFGLGSHFGFDKGIFRLRQGHLRPARRQGLRRGPRRRHARMRWLQVSRTGRGRASARARPYCPGRSGLWPCPGPGSRSRTPPCTRSCLCPSTRLRLRRLRT